jgi:hypothetical protein
MGGMDWIDVVEERDKWQALMNTIMHLHVA